MFPLFTRRIMAMYYIVIWLRCLEVTTQPLSSSLGWLHYFTVPSNIITVHESSWFTNALNVMVENKWRTDFLILIFKCLSTTCAMGAFTNIPSSCTMTPIRNTGFCRPYLRDNPRLLIFQNELKDKLFHWTVYLLIRLGVGGGVVYWFRELKLQLRVWY